MMKIQERLRELEQFNATPGEGVTRLPFSKEAKEAARYLRAYMEENNMTAQIDGVGNVVGVLKKTKDEPSAEKDIILLYSHYDTVKNGGIYDGTAGVVCAVEAAARFAAETERACHIIIAATNDEEGTMFGSGCLGSKALAGLADEAYLLRHRDENGRSIAEWMREWGSTPACLADTALPMERVKAAFEVHIEQGPVLEETNSEIGLVECITGLLRCIVTIKGRADHAGTTPMPLRHDALAAAGKVIAQLDQYAAQEENGSVVTAGFLKVFPNAVNVIAERVEFSIDIRSQDGASVERIFEKARERLREVSAETATDFEIDVRLRQPPVRLSPGLTAMLEQECVREGCSFLRMPSGAAHDSMIFAPLAETAMLFVPSEGGRSHCPQEYTGEEALERAVQILANVMLQLNRKEKG